MIKEGEGIMKIKDFLELSKEDYCFVHIIDEHSGKVKKYSHIQNAVREYGYFPLKSWYIELGALKIITRTEF